MKNFYDLTFEELNKAIDELGMKKFTSSQIKQWLFQKNIQDISLWSNISKINRKTLQDNFTPALPEVIKTAVDEQGTTKYLFRLHDGLKVESVLIPEKGHYTFCISSQAGCPLKCAFCATGKIGFKRNLTFGEIIGQILAMKKALGDYNGKLNLVFMGMGEPLLNYNALKEALDIITNSQGLQISPRNITISTAGITDKLFQFEKDFPKIKISFSLNASTPEMRRELMPVSEKYPIEDILRYFRETTRINRITFEYVLIRGINDSMADAKRIVKMVHGIPCKINLIPYNTNSGIDFKSPADKTVGEFSDFLSTRGLTVVVRWSKGRGLNSACGQLAGE